MEIISFKEANAKRLLFYFTGKPCKRGHFSVRRVGDCGCVECQKEQLKKWRLANPDKNREIDLAWKNENREKVRAKERARYAKDPKKYINKAKKQYAKNGERIRANRRAYHYEIYKDPAVRDRAAKRTKQWVEANPERARTNARNGKARRKNVIGSHTSADIKLIKRLQKNKCAYCKVKLGNKFHVDHILAVSRGGTNDRKNLQITCGQCNLRKWATDPISFAQRQGMLL